MNFRRNPLGVAAATTTAALAALTVWPAAVHASEAVEVMLQPHRAVYDMALLSASSSANLASISGRMVFEFTGSACEGYTVNSRFVTRLDDAEGNRRVTDLRLSTHETRDPDMLQFLNQTYTDERLEEEVKGTAEREPGGLKVQLTAPRERQEILPGSPLFPTDHIFSLVRAAEAGETFFSVDLYDGSEDGLSIYATNAVIGPRREGLGEPGYDVEAALAPLEDAASHCPIVLSYFETKEDRADTTPKYELRFLMYDNGISRNLTLDYGSFVLSGSLSALEYLEAPSCE
jgi:hypothetical protein